MPHLQAVPTVNLQSRKALSQQNETELLADLMAPRSDLAQGKILDKESRLAAMVLSES